MHRKINVGLWSVIVSFVLVASLPARAQDPDMTAPMPLTDRIVSLQYEVAPAGPPSVEPLSDNRVVFSLETSGGISGDLQGTVTTRLTEVHAQPAPPHQWFSSTFVIETDAGRIEGFYNGSLYLPEGAESAEVHGMGQVLFVSGAYADLFQARVFVQGAVPFENGIGVGESGSMVIAPQ